MFPCRTKYLINVHYLITEAHDVFSYIPSQIHFISELKCLSFEAVWYSEVYRHGFSWFIALPQRGDVRILRRSSHLRSILGRLRNMCPTQWGFGGVRGCHPQKFFKICMWNGAFFLHSEYICTNPKNFENLDVKLHFLGIRPPGANEFKRDAAELMNLA